MQRARTVLFSAINGALVLLMLLYGSLVLLVVLRPWLDDMQGLLLGHYPPDLLLLCAGIACVIGVPLVFFRRRASGIIWFSALLAVELSAALRRFSPREIHLEGGVRLWFYAAVGAVAVAIFLRFIHSPRDPAKGLTNR
jgi:hypothetical protein